MNFKTIIFSALVLTAISAQAEFLTPIHNYILESGRVVMLQGINAARGTAWYYDNNINKRVQVNLSEVSKETKKKINGVGENDFVYTTTVAGPQICVTYYVFENGMANVGCRTGKILSNIGPSRYEVGSFTGSTKNLLAAVSDADGYSKGEVVLLNGQSVRIKAIYSNGYVLTESASALAKLDTSGALLKTNVKIVTTRDLEKL